AGAGVRPYVRYDRATLGAVNGKKDQISVALAVAYLYRGAGAGWGPGATVPGVWLRKNRYSSQRSSTPTAARTENASSVSMTCSCRNSVEMPKPTNQASKLMQTRLKVSGRTCRMTRSP